jgi:hypothetical protein
MNTFKHPAKPRRQPWQFEAYRLMFGAGVSAVAVAIVIALFRWLVSAAHAASSFQYPL